MILKSRIERRGVGVVHITDKTVRPKMGKPESAHLALRACKQRSYTHERDHGSYRGPSTSVRPPAAAESPLRMTSENQQLLERKANGEERKAILSPSWPPRRGRDCRARRTSGR